MKLVNLMNTIFEKHGWFAGRMIYGSKTMYMINFPERNPIFNANIFTEQGEKAWWGDIELTLDDEKLQKIANELQTNLYVLREHDGRNGKLTLEEMKKYAVLIVQYDAQT